MNSDDLKLSRRIQNLVPLPVMLTLALLVLVPAPAGAAPPDKFEIGDRVQVLANGTGVRDAPAGTRIGEQPPGALGTVLAGPVVANNITWWQINYDTGTDGWSGQDNLTKLVVEPPPPAPPPPPPPSADLALSLTDIPDPLTVNGQLTYTITVRNNGPGTATGVGVVDSLPPGATVLVGPASSSQGECRGNTVTVDCDLGTLAADAQATVTINVIPTVTGDLSNAATVFAVEPEPDLANNSSTQTTTVRPPPDPALAADLAITTVAEVNPRASGQGFTYRLTVRNDGPDTATGVQLTNDLPRGIALGPITASQSQANCTDTDPMLCTLGTLTSGAEATVTIDVIRTEVGTLPNRAGVNNGDQHDPNTANNFALTSALDLPTPQSTCNSERCTLRLTCNLSDLLERRCDNQVTLFVDTRARRLSDERAARQPKLVRFAAVIRNSPGGRTENVRLKLTPKGKKLARTLIRQGKKKVRGVMEIRNHVGGIGIDTIPLTVRLR